MMKQYMLLVLFTLTTMASFSQESFIRFYESSDTVFSAYELMDIFYDETINKYYGLVIYRDENCQGFSIIKLDESGILEQESFYCNPDSIDEVLAFRTEVGIQKIGEERYYFRGNVLFSSFRTFDYYFDAELNTIEYNISDTIPIDSIQAHQIRSLETYEGDIIQTGNIQKLNFELDPYIRRVDTSGEIIWNTELYINDGLDNHINSLVVHDSLLILGMYFDGNGSTSTFIPQCHVTMLSAADGSVVHELDLQLESRNLSPTEVIPFEQDGEQLLAFGSAEGWYDDFTNTYTSQIRYFITDMDGNVRDSIRLGNSISRTNGLINNQGIEGGFISSGHQILDDESARLPYIGLFSHTADTVWWSMYDFNNEDLYIEDYQVTDQTILNDGSIVICGNLIEYDKENFQTVRERPFVMKLDPDGCLEAGCRDLTSVAEELDDQLSIYPNPFESDFTLTSKAAGQVIVYDMQGRLMSTHSIAKGENRISLVDNQSGIYMYHVSLSDGTEQSGKVIKL